MSFVRPIRYCFSFLENIRKYKGSNLQKRIHDYQTTEEKIQPIKQKIDYECIDKQSTGSIMIRQFLFQEKMPEIKLNFPQTYLIPNGKWRLEEIFEIVKDNYKTKSEKDVNIILQHFKDNMEWRLDQYYTKIGKKNYTFSLKEELQKIAQMNDAQFQQFLRRLESEEEN